MEVETKDDTDEVIDIRSLLDECIFLPYNIQEHGIIRLIVDDYLEYRLSVVEGADTEKMNRGLGYLHDTIHDLNNGLCGACYGGHVKLAELMVFRGANYWNWGLHGACRGGHLKLAELMISKGADDWNHGLYGACEGDHLELVQLVASKGISKDNIRRCLSDRHTNNTDIIAYLESLS